MESVLNDNNSTDIEDYHYKLKVSVLGDSQSGKTSFLDILDLESSEEISERTVLHLYEQIILKIIYWETPGKERALKYISNYTLGSHLAIVIFDVNKRSSFEKAKKILENIDICNIPVKYLISNKENLISNKRNNDIVQPQEAEELAYTYKCKFYSCDVTSIQSIKIIYDNYVKDIKNIITFNESKDYVNLNILMEKNINVGKRFFVLPEYKEVVNKPYFPN